MLSPTRIGLLAAVLWGAMRVCAAAPAPTATVPPIRSRVLVIDSYHPGFPWSERLEAALRAGLADADPEIFTECMDTKRFPVKAQEPLISDLIERKYAGLQFQVVVAADDNAYQFVLRYGDALFGSAPVVFCGVNDFVFEQLKGHPNITGVVQTTDAYDTLTVACRFLPAADRVVFIHDDTSTGRGYRASFERDFVRFIETHPGMGVRFLSGAELTTEELLREAAAFRPTDLVLLSRWFVDRAGEYIAEEAFVPELSSRSPVPIWGLVGIGTGTVGGRLVTPESQGAAAARLTARILAGTAPWAMPVQVSGANEHTYDCRQLRRWGFSRAGLPRGAVLVHEPSSFFRSHRPVVLVGAGLVAIQAALILLLAAVVVRHRRTEAQHLDSERRLKLVTEGVSLGVFDWYSSRPCLVVNRQLADLVGLDPTAADVQSVRRVLRRVERQDRHQLLRRASRCLRGYASSFECDCRLGGRADHPRTLSVQGTVADLNGAGGVRILGTVRDVTESRQASQRQLRLERELLEARKYESLGVLAGGLAHDFNNLLQPIIGNASIADDELPADSALRPLVQDISASGRRASELAQKLLAYAGQAPTVPRRIDAARMLERLADALKGGVPEDRRLDLEASASSVPAYVDVAQYRQILTSLVANAVEATAPGGRISVRVASVYCAVGQLRSQQSGRELPSGRYARVTVEDDGEGIAPENLDHVFDPFFTTRFLGRGLGLAAVAGIVRRHGGALRVTSDLGHGSRFDVYLPALPAGEAGGPDEPDELAS